MKNVIYLISGFVLVAVALVVSMRLTIEKFGSVWNYSMSKLQPTDHYRMVGEMWSENTLLCIAILAAIVLGMFLISKFITRKK